MKEISNYGTATEISAITGIPRSTIRSAIRRGEMKTAYTVGGLPLIELASARTWAEQERHAGRPRKPLTSPRSHAQA